MFAVRYLRFLESKFMIRENIYIYIPLYNESLWKKCIFFGTTFPRIQSSPPQIPTQNLHLWRLHLGPGGVDRRCSHDLPAISSHGVPPRGSLTRHRLQWIRLAKGQSWRVWRVRREILHRLGINPARFNGWFTYSHHRFWKGRLSEPKLHDDMEPSR